VALQPFVGLWPLFSFVIIFTQTVGLLGRVISPSQDRYLRCPYTYESGSRVRLGELDSGAGLRYISPHTHERTLNSARTFQYPE
jgi:hypothetical protein